MATPNYYDLSGSSWRIGWYPSGKGGPVTVGGPPPGAPVLVFASGMTEGMAWGDELIVGPPSPAGRLVTAVVKRTQIVPGGVSSLAILIPDVIVDHTHVHVRTLGALAHHRGVADLGPGQLETYTSITFHGSASVVVLPL
jgi:hypothetical protein